MSQDKPTLLVTGVSGNLGVRLLPMLSHCNVLGVDIHPPSAPLFRFERLDLGEESSCTRMIELLRETGAQAVAHLAFVIDQVRTGILDLDRMWRINVAGTARVAEAIAEVNRRGGAVRKLLFVSSVSAYGPDLPHPVNEDHPLRAHTLPYAIHKRESDEVVRSRAENLGPCHTYVLRPPIFAGTSVENYLIGGFRGTPTGAGKLASWMRARGKRLPFVIPFGKRYQDVRFQFIHVDDVARLIAYILDRPESHPGLTVLNISGRGEALTLRQCLEIAGTRGMRFPGRWGCRKALEVMWQREICAVPPEAVPYITSDYLMDTSRLERFLGNDYERVICYSVEEALRDSMVPLTQSAALAEQSVSA